MYWNDFFPIYLSICISIEKEIYVDLKAEFQSMLTMEDKLPSVRLSEMEERSEKIQYLDC